MSQYDIRYGRLEDIGSFRQKLVEVVGPLKLYNEWARTAEIAKYSVEHLTDLLESDPNSMLIASDGDQIAGFLLTRPDDGLLWISWFGISREHRRKGLADQLIKRLILDASNRNCWKLWCDTRDENEHAIKILQKNGFILCCKLEKHWYGQNFLLWQRFLGC